MIKIRHELDSWDEGRAFMNRLADEIGGSVEELDADLKISTDRIDASCHFDAREFSFLLLKLHDEGLENTVRGLLTQYNSN